MRGIGKDDYHDMPGCQDLAYLFTFTSISLDCSEHMNNKLLLLLLGIIWFSQAIIAQGTATMREISLNQHWQFRQVGDREWLPATVPGTVHTDLLANKKIEDPYYRTNERQLQWIDKTEWEYRTSFYVDTNLLKFDVLNLEFLGLDTYVDVYLNGTRIISADNFFIAWKKDIKPLVRLGDNNLRLHFLSPARKGIELLEAHGYGLPAGNDQSEVGEMGDQRVSVFIRKPGYHFGWDWGPRLVTSGIYRPVQLRAWSKVRLEDVYFHQDELSDTLAQLTAHAEITATTAQTVELLVWHGEELLGAQSFELAAGPNTLDLPFQIQNPRRWWTHDLGEPFRYALRAELRGEDKVLNSLTHQIGLRTVRIVQTPDAKGASFYVELNGRPIFAKGANYIPNDVFIPRTTPDQYEWAIFSTARANMNMLRVWGGGFYENDIFYDLCDEYGILVWQDFMFACSMYPGDPDFLRRVREEAEYNVKRLRNHPSIALWCGNNEIDIAWAQHKESRGWGWKQLYSPTQRKDIWRDYQAVFDELLPQVVDSLQPGTFYWPSSPFFKEGDHAGENTPEGDIHYWGVWHGEHPFDGYYENVGRFMSEYGFQSFPEFRTVKSYTVPGDWDIESEVMAAHQRSGIGNLRIRSYMEDHYQVPKRFDQQLYVGQVLQAEGIRMAIEAHRSAMPYCMGSLYWQLNDCWPVASWSGMD
ncbi:MAG: glycoside hydrolase family 2 protein [Lewinellaceae bacterium]|nr:glycoside hydrolase family 2 protein [Lewinellaceae bacterium]